MACSIIKDKDGKITAVNEGGIKDPNYDRIKTAVGDSSGQISLDAYAEARAAEMKAFPEIFNKDGSRKRYIRENDALNRAKKMNSEGKGVFEVIKVMGEKGDKRVYHAVRLKNPGVMYNLDALLQDTDEELEIMLVTMMGKLGVRTEVVQDMKERFGIDSLGVADILNKTIYVASKRNIDTLPEEVAHMITFMIPKTNPDLRYLLENIESWSEYAEVEKEYFSIYRDYDKVKLEAVAKLLSKSIVQIHKQTKGSDLTLLQRALDVVTTFLETLRIVSQLTPQQRLDKLSRKMAIKMITGQISEEIYSATRLSDNYKLVSYDEVFKSNPEVKAVNEDIIKNTGSVLSGSLALAKQGTVYRPSDHFMGVHDLDYVTDLSNSNRVREYASDLVNKQRAVFLSEGLTGNSQIIQIAVLKEGYRLRDIGVEVQNDGTFDVELMPEEKYKGFTPNQFVMPTQIAVNAEGQQVSSDEAFVLVDFFITPDAAKIRQEENIDSWKKIFEGKASLGTYANRYNFYRPKDIIDFLNFVPYEKSEIDTENPYVFYQIKESTPVNSEISTDENGRKEYRFFIGDKYSKSTNSVRVVENLEPGEYSIHEGDLSSLSREQRIALFKAQDNVIPKDGKIVNRGKSTFDGIKHRLNLSKFGWRVLKTQNHNQGFKSNNIEEIESFVKKHNLGAIYVNDSGMDMEGGIKPGEYYIKGITLVRSRTEGVSDIDLDKYGLVNLRSKSHRYIPRRTKKDKWEERYFSNSDVVEVPEILRNMSQSSVSSYTSALAKKLLSLAPAGYDRRIQLMDVDLFEETVRRYASKKQLDEIPESQWQALAIRGVGICMKRGSRAPGDLTLLHEILHDYTMHVIDSDDKKKHRFVSFFEEAKKRLITSGMDESTYQLSNAHEFLTGIFTSPAFANELKKLKPIRKKEEIGNLWQEFVHLLASFFQWGKEITLLEDAMDLGMILIQDGSQTIPNIGNFQGLEENPYGQLQLEEDPSGYFVYASTEESSDLPDDVDPLKVDRVRIEYEDYNSIPVPESETLYSNSTVRQFNKIVRREGTESGFDFYIREEFTEPGSTQRHNRYYRTSSAETVRFTDEITPRQQQLVDKLDKTASIKRDPKFITREEFSAAQRKGVLKPLMKVRDGLFRNVIYDEATGKEVFIGARPSDWGQLNFAKYKKFQADKVSEENNTRESIITRGMGTTLHYMMELIIGELDRQNTLDPDTGKFSLLSPDAKIKPLDEFISESKGKFLKDIFDRPGALEELTSVYQTMKDTGKYIHKLPKERLIDPGLDVSVAEEDMQFTVDRQDFESLVDLGFRVYHQIYNKQAEISWNRQVKGKPVIRLEAPVLNRDEDIMGSIDALAIFDNGQVAHYDYKFMSLEQDKELERVEGLSDAEIAKQKAAVYMYNGQVYTNKRKKGLAVIPHKIQAKLERKKLSWDPQGTKYKEILTKAYGVESLDIVESRMIPVGMILNTRPVKYTYKTSDGETKEATRYEPVSSLKYLEFHDESIKQVPVARELSGDKSLDVYIDQLMKEAKSLRNKLSVDRSNLLLKEQLLQIEENIVLLQSGKEVDKVGKKITEMAEALMPLVSQDPFIYPIGDDDRPMRNEDGELYMAKNRNYMTWMDLENARHMLNVYSGLALAASSELERLKTTDPEKHQAVYEALDAQTRITNNLLKLIADEIEKRFLTAARDKKIFRDREIKGGIEGRIAVTERDMLNSGIGRSDRESKFGDIGMIGGMFNALSDINHPHVRLAKGLIDEFYFNAKSYANDIADRLEKATKALTEFGESRGLRGLEVYEPVTNYIEEKGVFSLVSPFKYELYEAVDKARTEKDINWLKDNIEFDRERYDRAYANYKKSVEVTYKGNQQAINEQLEKFRKDYEMREGDGYAYAWRNHKNRYWKPKNPETWYSDKYKDILANKPLKDYYELALEIVKDMQDFVGDTTRIGDYFIPNVQKDTIDMFAEHGIGVGVMSNMTSMLDKVLELRESDPDVGVTLDGEDVRTVPLPYFDPIPMGVRHKSKDVTKNLLIGAYSARLHAERKAVEGIILGLRQSLANTKILAAGVTGERSVNQYIQGSESELIKSFDKMMGYYLYGKRLQGGSTEASKKFNKAVTKLQSFHTMVNLTLNFFSATAGHINAKSQMVQLAMGDRYFTTSDLASARIDRAKMSVKGVLLDEEFDLSAEGHEQLTRERANRMSPSTLRKKWDKDMSFILQRRSDDAIDKDILYAMARNYVLHPNGVDVFHKRDASWKLKGTRWEEIEPKTIHDMMEIQELQDDKPMVKFMNMDGSAEMTKEQFIRFRNKVKSVASRVKGNYNKDDIATYKTNTIMNVLMHYRGWIPAMFLERWKNSKYDYTMEEIEVGRFRAVVGEIIGNGLIPSLKNFVSTVLRFSGDMVTFNRFGFLTPDLDNMRRRFTNWRQANPGEYDALLEKYSNLGEGASEAAFNEWVETHRKQLASAVSEVRAYMTVVALMLAVGFSAGDDEQEDNPFVRKLVELLNRTSMEIGFFTSPQEALKLVTRGVIPMLGMANDVIKLAGNTLSEGIDLATGTEEGRRAVIFEPGDEPFTMSALQDKYDPTPKLHYTFKFIPFLKGVNNLMEITEMDKERQTFLERLFNWEDDAYYTR